jgi:hypothetical protein
MPRYSVEFENKELKAIHHIPENATETRGFHEDHTGRTLHATIHAKNDKEADEKARRLEIELQTGITKENLQKRNKRKRSN